MACLQILFLTVITYSIIIGIFIWYANEVFELVFKIYGIIELVVKFHDIMVFKIL